MGTLGAKILFTHVTNFVFMTSASHGGRSDFNLDISWNLHKNFFFLLKNLVFLPALKVVGDVGSTRQLYGRGIRSTHRGFDLVNKNTKPYT